MTKGTSPSKGGTLAGLNAAPAQSAARTGAKPPGPGVANAPRAQSRAAAAPAVPTARSVAIAAPVRKTALTPIGGSDDGVTMIEAASGGAPKVAPVPPPSAAALVAAQIAAKPAVRATHTPDEEIGPVVRSMVEQALAPLDRTIRSMVEQATAPLERSIRTMVEQAMAPLDRTVRAAVEQAVAPLDRVLRDLQRRLDELERRPAPVVPAPASRGQVVPVPARTFDVAAIERNLTLGPEVVAFDGRRRRTRLVLTVVFACLVVFAGLFAALAQSYTHAHG